MHVPAWVMPALGLLAIAVGIVLAWVSVETGNALATFGSAYAFLGGLAIWSTGTITRAILQIGRGAPPGWPGAEE